MGPMEILIKLFPMSNLDDIIRCIGKATIIEYDGNNVLVADNTYIYFYGTTVPKTKQAYKFYTKHKDKMANKLLYARNKKMHSNHCEQVDGELHKWVD